MSFMKLVCLLYIIIIATACYKKDATSAESGATNVETTKSSTELSDEALSVQKPKAPMGIVFSKVFRESIYFAKSLEREALKLLIRDNPQQNQTLFSVLSYALESHSGAKKSAPFGLDCTRYDLKKSGSVISVLKLCTKPAVEVASINVDREDSEYHIKFNIHEWGRVVGASAALTGSDIKCQLKIVKEKLNLLKCENWAMQTNQEQLSATVIKTDEFVFQRNAAQQFVIRGGFYKELIKNKKIDIEVPLDGKIKIIEKEIKVIDEFEAQKNGVIDGQKENSPKEEVKSIEFSQGPGQGEKPIQSEGESQAVSQDQNQSQDSGEGQSQVSPENSGQVEEPQGEASPQGRGQPQNRRGRGQAEPSQIPIEGGGRGR